MQRAVAVYDNTGCSYVTLIVIWDITGCIHATFTITMAVLQTWIGHLVCGLGEATDAFRLLGNRRCKARMGGYFSSRRASGIPCKNPSFQFHGISSYVPTPERQAPCHGPKMMFAVADRGNWGLRQCLHRGHKVHTILDTDKTEPMGGVHLAGWFQF